MKNLLIAFAALTALAGVAVLFYRSLSRTCRDEEPGGFREWVKNPDYKRFATEQMAARDAELESLTVPGDISDSEIQKMVDRLFELEDRNGLNYTRLELVGVKASPFLVRALDDPRVVKRFQTDKFFHHGPTIPLQRVAKLLVPLDGPLIVRTLTGYIGHQDDEVRKCAARVLGEIGTPDCVQPVVEALGDQHDYVRSYAMQGIGRSIENGRASREFLDGVFAALVKLLDRRGTSSKGDAPRLVLAIDRERALPIFLSPEYFKVENRALRDILGALNDSGHKVPHDFLLPLLDELRPLAHQHPYAYAYAAGLTAYARNPDSATEQVLRTEVNSPQERVQEAAAEGLAILGGTDPPSRTVFEAERERGSDSLTEPQKRYFAVRMYDVEVNNGGHSQYFVNSTGDHWPLALAGLKAIGATERAGILHEAVGLFGRKGPSEDNEVRHRQLSKLSGKQDETLGKLDDRYYASRENVTALLALYAIDNKEAFH